MNAFIFQDTYAKQQKGKRETASEGQNMKVVIWNVLLSIF